MKKIVSLFITLLIAISAFSQVNFTATAKKVVATGERFRLTYTVNAKGSNFKAPAINGASVLSGPNQSSSSSVQIINGQVSQEVNNSYSYILVANEEGKINIPAAVINVDGKQYKSNTLTIEVVKSSAQASQKNTQSSNSNQTQSASVSDDDLFVKVTLNKTNVYVGEPVVATLKVYTRAKLSNFKDYKFPSFSGFYTAILEEPDRISLERENINGQIYETGLFRKILLYPQKSGTITVEPFELECILLQQVRRRSFFDSGYREFVKKVASKPVTVNVKPLPTNKPGNFGGAVGNFKFTVEADKLSVKENDAINLKVQITGTGNLKLVESPEFNFPTDFDAYDPKVNLNVKNSRSGAKGSKTFDYLIIPRHAGTFTIPSTSFTFFNLSSKKFQTIVSDPIEITVEKGEGDNNGVSMVQGFTKEDVKFIGKDIRYQKTGEFDLYPQNSFIFGTITANLVYTILSVLFLSLIVLKRHQIKENQNIAKVKNRQANKLSKKRLKKAHTYLADNNNSDFYEELMRAMWGYMSDKLNISLSQLTKDSVSDQLKSQSIVDDDILEFKSIINQCEFARYAPSGEEGATQKLYDRAVGLINKLEQTL